MFSISVIILVTSVWKANCQCYQDSDISLIDTGYQSWLYQTSGPDQCIANYTLLNENFIDDSACKGIICSKKGSTATDGTWTHNGTGTVTCGTNTGQVHCVQGTGSVTLYTTFSSNWESFQGNYTCCIEGLCASVRVFQEDNFRYLFPNNNIAVIESCTIIPPSDITANPQQYIVQMITSGVPPVRLTSYINCTDGNGIKCGESYYTLIDLGEERFQYSIPVTWSTDDSTSNTDHYYSCRAKFGERKNLNYFIDTKLTTLIQAPSAPIVSYDIVDSTTVSVSWNITGDVSGFIINITSSDGFLDTMIKQRLTDGLLREFLVNGLVSERNYTIEVRGYYELLGPAGLTNIRLIQERDPMKNNDAKSNEKTCDCTSKPLHQFDVCCNVENLGKFVKIQRRSFTRIYIVCPVDIPEHCNKA